MDEGPPLLVMRDPSRWVFGPLLVIWFGVGISVVVGNVRHGGPGAFGGGVVFLLPLVLFAVFTKQLWHPLVLTTSELIAPSVWTDQHIPVGDIAGIGLCYVLAGRGSSWRTTIWKADGTRLFVIHHLWGGVNVTKSRAAKQVSELWQAVAGLQGPSGPLVTRALQHHEGEGGLSAVSRVWCPDDGTLYRPRDRHP